MSGMTHDERDAAITRAIGVAPGETVRIEMPADIVAEHEGAATPQPPAPCGYCRRCAIHDDPGGCAAVEQWERENPAAAIESIKAAGMAGGWWRIEQLQAQMDREAELVAWGCTPYEARIRAQGEGL